MIHFVLRIPTRFGAVGDQKFESKKSVLTVEGTNDSNMLVNKFADYFSKLVCPNSYDKAVYLEDTFKKDLLTILVILVILMTYLMLRV